MAVKLKTLKKIEIPIEIKNALKNYPKEERIFNNLPYSHKKEYIDWIMSAKKEETKQSRINKMIERLK